VLKWFLASLRGQQYAGRKPSDGVKKPLNAFLGEVFVGECGPEDAPCKLVSEQVSHHPPVTACYLWNDVHGVRAEGYTRQEITFTGTVNIQQIGHAVLHLDRWDEDYLIPLPNVKVKGILTGGPYPELNGTYDIVCSSGFIAEVDFSGTRLLGVAGKKNHVEGGVYRVDGEKRKEPPLFTAEGTWSGSFTIKDAQGEVIDTHDSANAPASEFRTEPLEKQDPWESRQAWKGVLENIHAGNMRGVAEHKSKLENAQRELRKRDETSEEKWESLFFRREEKNEVAEKLLSVVGQTFNPKDTKGVWRFDRERAETLERPWRGGLAPFGDGRPRVRAGS
jgi:oxysterol-binding protein-related protein 9/10/11